MSAEILKQINKNHIESALSLYHPDEHPKNRYAKKYVLEIDRVQYPIKIIGSIASKIATGIELKPADFKTTQFQDILTKLGFEITQLAGPDIKEEPLGQLISEYKKLIVVTGFDDEIYKWKLVKEFQGRPDTKADDFTEEVKSINFSNLIYGVGIGVINQIAREFPNDYRECFQRLFSNQNSLQQRIANFHDETLALFRRFEPNEKRSHHHDERTTATFLTYYDPNTYSFYKDSFYQKLCKILNEQPRKKGEKYVHYLDIVSDFITEYIETDEELISLVRKYQDKDVFEDLNYKILAQDILYRTLEKNVRTFNSVIDDLKSSMQDDPALPQFIINEKRGKKGTREWVWVSDEKKSFFDEIAHYEIEYDSKNRGIRVCLHFEELVSSKSFSEELKMQLPERIEWFKWFGSRSLRSMNLLKITEEHVVTEILNELEYMDLMIGDRIREIKASLSSKGSNIQPPKTLNQILYGPPGTGKTYNTINKALEILGVETSGSSRKEIKDLYLQKVNEGQISFITFHQSLGYEDFIEGIKPQTSKLEGGHISYEVESGVFKSLCDTARIIPELKKQSKSIFNKARFYKMSIGGKLRPEIHDWCLAHDCIALGYGNDKNFDAFSEIENWNEYRDLFIKTYPELVNESRYHIQAMFTFQRMAIGDIVVISKGNHVIDAIGKVSGEYYWDDQNPTAYCQFRKVEWIAVNINMEPSVFFSKNISQQTIYEFYDADVKKDAFISLFDSKPDEQKNFVLIIDEINRGNVSQVFGELITLLEEDKRAGRPEALEVILPYSKERFSVPNNVHIIGTMNTADRSVEVLDTALRRRFSFIEMLPKPELLGPYQLLVHFYERYEHISWEDWINKFHKKAMGFYEFIGLGGVTVGDKKEEDIYDIIMKTKDLHDLENKLTAIGCHLSSPVNLAYFLEVLNKRIEVLKDGNHQIGHAYFINIESFDDLMDVFRDKIIPLLQEYFYGDTEKIQLVLGKGFVRKESAKGFSFAFHESDLEGEYDDRECYYILNECLNEVSLFKEALISANLGYNG